MIVVPTSYIGWVNIKTQNHYIWGAVSINWKLIVSFLCIIWVFIHFFCLSMQLKYCICSWIVRHPPTTCVQQLEKPVKRPGLSLDLSSLLIIWQNQHWMQTDKQVIKTSLSSQHHDKSVIKTSSSSHYRCTLIHNLQALLKNGTIFSASTIAVLNCCECI